MAEGGALRELLVHFGIEVDDHELEAFDEGLTGVIDHLKSATAAFGAFLAFREVKEFFDGTIEAAAKLEDMSKALDVSTDALQKFNFAASLHGVEDGSFLLGRLSRQIGQAAGGSKEAGKEFNKLGIKLKNSDGSARDTMDVIDDLADSFKDMKSGPERAAAAQQFFGRSGKQLIPLLQDGKEGLHAVYEEFEELGGMMSEEFIHAAHDADDEMKKMHVALTGLRVRAVNAFLPSIIKLVKWVKESTVAFGKFIDGTHALQHAFEFLKILAIVGGVWKLVGAVKALAEAETLADLASPFTWALIAIGLLYVAYDDLKTALEGGDSLFGKAFGTEGIQTLKKVITETTEEVHKLWSGLKGVGDVVGAIGRGAQGVAHGVRGAYRAATGNEAGADEDYDEGTQAFAKSAQDFKDAITPDAEDYAQSVKDQGLAAPAVVRSPTSFARGQQPGDIRQPTSFVINNLNVDVKHTGNEKPEQLAGQISSGVQEKLQKEMLNSLNAQKTY